jgi:hypothetical protein
MLRKHLIFILYLLCGSLAAVAQSTPPLERGVSIKASDEPASVVLGKIAAQTGIKFSYSPTSIPADKKVTFTIRNKPVRTVLRIMFGETVQYRQKSDFIILTAKAAPPAPAAIKEIAISGYVYDQNGDKLTSASILNKSEHIAAVTNQYGYYKMMVPANKFPVKLKIEKEHYLDTSFTVSSGNTDIDIVLNIPPPPAREEAYTYVRPSVVPDELMAAGNTETDTTDTTSATPASPTLKETFRSIFNGFILDDETKANIRNIKDTLFTGVQFSLVPYISTNKLLVGNTVNDVSINLLAGYSQGVNKMELGGLMNIDRGDVRYFQAAGLMNAVGGNVEGVQLAGVGNLNSGRGTGFRAAGVVNAGHHMDGVQLAGVVNINADYRSGYVGRSLRALLSDTMTGFQAAGVGNINAGFMEGVRLAGVFNTGRDMDGVQSAGVTNINFGHVNGVQTAGAVNITFDSSETVQVAGVMNVNIRKMTGASIAGLVNVSTAEVDGAQIATLVNIAGHSKGLQLGLVNISDSVSGIAIGLLSFSRKGYHKLELWGDEVIQTQLSFRTGVQWFHNIFTAGTDLTRREDKLWCFGYGIGSSVDMGEKWKFTADVLSQVILKAGRVEDAPQLISLYAGIERMLGKHLSVGLGPAGRMMIRTNTGNSEYAALQQKLIPYTMASGTFGNGTEFTIWAGGKLTIKFF